VVWAHNSHIGDAAATAIFNIGELCKAAYSRDAVAIGFGTDRGTVAAARGWNEPVRIMTVQPARPDSYENVFRHTGIARSLTDWTTRPAEHLREALGQPRLERAIGVVYRPETELLSHYFRAVLPEQFDAYVWFAETNAITALGPRQSVGAPETYPTGL
jgi:erythromycin esterase-like protein